ncbi:MAG: hypothetical protein HGA62_07205 [Chlorobiaceae bacterium]|nr:hypothetical protein [Chlorobiaceae bacterium]NTV60644.1 hypothetical protein [Chlorobiaceae bacterium]
MTSEGLLPILKQGAEAWNSWREGFPHEEIDFSGVDFNTIVPKINLDGINLSRACLSNADFSLLSLKKANFAFANLEGAHFLFSNLEGADFRGTNLKKASFEDACLKNILFCNADFQGTSLSNALCSGADFSCAHFGGTDFSGANLEHAKVFSVTYEQQVLPEILKESGFRPGELWKHRLDFYLDTKMRCRGVHATSAYGNPRFIQFLRDVDYLEELYHSRSGSSVIFIWWLFADCGRSLKRWAFWTFAFVLLFALLYTLLGEENFKCQYITFGLPSMMYFSIISFTSYGSGDIIPITQLSTFLVSVEVIVGYMMLGGLISIFSSKLGRRSG